VLPLTSRSRRLTPGPRSSRLTECSVFQTPKEKHPTHISTRHGDSCLPANSPAQRTHYAAIYFDIDSEVLSSQGKCSALGVERYFCISGCCSYNLALCSSDTRVGLVTVLVAADQKPRSARRRPVVMLAETGTRLSMRESKSCVESPLAVSSL
jgi:hypothetical protein